MAKNMMRIGNMIIDKDRVESVELGKKGALESVGIMMKSGRLLGWSGPEKIEVRAFLIKQFPCEDQTLWLED